MLAAGMPTGKGGAHKVRLKERNPEAAEGWEEAAVGPQMHCQVFS